MEENKKDKKGEFNLAREIWEWVYTLAIAIVIAFAIKTFLFDIVRVDGSSMYPTLENNDRLIVTKLGYSPEQGDIVILDSAYKKREAYYSQLADEQGKDKLSFIDKLLEKRNLPDALDKVYYVKRVIAMPNQTVDITDDGKVLVDGVELKEEYANGLTASIDSTVDYPLTVDEDSVFVMGDNRMHSKDSRASDLGCVPIDALLGKSQIRIWPLNKISTTK